MLLTYVFTYFIVTLLCTAIGAAVLANLTFDMGTESELKAFKAFIACFMLFCLTNSVWIWINNGYLDIDGTWNSVLNLVAVCICSYFWFFFIELKLDPGRVESTAFRIVSIAPLAAAIAIVVTTPATHLVFYYTDQNVYMHGPLYPVLEALAMLYLIIASARLFTHRKMAYNEEKKKEFFTLGQFLFYPLTAGVVDMIIPDLPVMELSTMAGIIIVFTNMQTSRIFKDPLTGLDNRRNAELHLDGAMKLASESDPVVLYLGDADGLKMINDRYGHLEGDRALKLIGKVLKRAADGADMSAARWGGDEFVVLSQGDPGAADPKQFTDRVEDGLREISKREDLPYGLSLSFGWAECVSPHVSPNELFAQADRMMYGNKETRGKEAGKA